jgi:hypothetical protein
MPDEKDVLIKILGDALQSASQHLDYCGYGDKWERECAKEEGLRDKVTGALEHYETYNKGAQ